MREWAAVGLSEDTYSIENALTASTAGRYPLMIDPHGRASKWVKSLEKDKELVVVNMRGKASNDGRFLFRRELENAIMFGLPLLIENVGEGLLDPLLEHVLLKQCFRQGGTQVVQLGDAVIEWSKNFRLYITTKLANPHFLPKTLTMVTLINFALTPEVLQGQLLRLIVAVERPELEAEKEAIDLQVTDNKWKLRQVEDCILQVLTACTGPNILEDEHAVEALSPAKEISICIREKDGGN